MFKKALFALTVLGGFSFAGAQSADAGYFVRRPIAPVRRVAARAVLPPYPVARRVVRRPVYYSPVLYTPAPVVHGPSIYIGF
ncbi:MAG: hypothetical protein AAGA92_00880 [Planctomycetota bacterium]